MTQFASIDRLVTAAHPLPQRLIQHPVYAAIQSLDDMRTFMDTDIHKDAIRQGLVVEELAS